MALIRTAWAIVQLLATVAALAALSHIIEAANHV